MDFAVTKRRSVRQLAGRKRSVYYEGDSDDDGVDLLSDGYNDEADEQDAAAPPPPVTKFAVTKRRSARQLAGRKRSIYYEGDSDDDDVDLLGDGYNNDAHDYDAAPPSPALPHQPRKKVRRSRPTTRSIKKERARIQKPKKRTQNLWKRPLGALPKKKSHTKPAKAPIPSDGVIPDWTSLPVEILRDIFIYASEDIHEQTVSGSASATWLVKNARKISSALAVPALEAYYLSPALHSVVQPHHLLELLRLQTEDTFIKYRYKIKRLEINVKQLAYSASGRSLFDLSALVRELPHLQQLEIIHPMDEPPYRPLKLQKWFYPSDLFQTMDESQIRLRKWRWSRDMLKYDSPEDMYRSMTQVHRGRSFEHLERLVVCGFDYNDSAEPSVPEDANERPPNLTSAISALPNIKDLTLSSCDIVMEDFLLRLPNTLERLELTNCLEVTAEILQTFLLTNGSQLRELVLNSNAALSLAFLSGLKIACPKLETLTMDTTYYSERTNWNDAYAFYDHLLTAEEVPTWPSTLRYLEFSNLQKWGADAASTLFQSLIDAAPELPHFRHLSIQAHIDIAWRDRADFRDNWVDKLRATFLHKTAPPLPYLCSLKRFREWKDEQPLKIIKPGDDEEELPQRQMSHIRITPRKRGTDHILYSEDDEDEDDAKSGRKRNSAVRLPARRSARIVESQSAASLSATPGADSAEDSFADEVADDTYVQGLCEVVDIRIDNQRPRETQYTEANFLDSEVSGDEDWHSGAELSDDGYASA